MPRTPATTNSWTAAELTRLVAFCFLYFFAASIAYLFLVTPDGITVIWPAGGVFLAALLLTSKIHWWVVAIFLGIIDFSVQVTLGKTDLPPGALFSLITTVQALASAALLRSFHKGALSFESFADVFALLVWAIAIPTAVFGIPAALTANAYFETPLLDAWTSWLIADGLGVLVVTPLLLVAHKDALERIKKLSSAAWIETAVLLAILTLTTLLVFTTYNPAGATLASYSYLPFIFLIWIAMRLGVGTTTLAILLFVTTAIWFDALTGNDNVQAMRSSVIALETFLLVIVTGSLCLAAVAAERTNESQRFKNTQDNLRSLIEFAPLGIFVGNREKYLYCNPAGAEIFRLSDPSEVVGLDITTFHHPAERKSAEQRINALLDNETLATRKFEIKIVDAEGTERLIESTAARFQWEGQPANLAMISEITERKQAEEALRRAQKMEAIGQLTGGIAHDFNNILGIIVGNLELVQDEDDKSAFISQRIDMALNAVNRGINITDKLLNFSRRRPTQTQVTSVNQLIETIQELLAKSLTASIQIENNLGEGLWSVDVNPGDLQDALVNLSLNARDAMPAGGTLVIETANKVLDSDYVKLNPQVHEGDYVMISVSDTGIGMQPDVVEKIFEPFYSTKDEGKGTGLGLSMVYGFVQRSSGHIKVYSEPGQGSTFRLFLPRAQRDRVVQSSPVITPAALPRGTETVLIVDDEADFIDIATLNLRNLGYTVVNAPDGDAALAQLAANPAIGLLFSDVVMPGGKDGYHLAVEAHKLYPALKILLTSGFTQRREQVANGDGEFISQLAGRLLSKPYNRADLAMEIRRTLDEDD